MVRIVVVNLFITCLWFIQQNQTKTCMKSLTVFKNNVGGLNSIIPYWVTFLARAPQSVQYSPRALIAFLLGYICNNLVALTFEQKQTQAVWERFLIRMQFSRNYQLKYLSATLSLHPHLYLQIYCFYLSLCLFHFSASLHHSLPILSLRSDKPLSADHSQMLIKSLFRE